MLAQVESEQSLPPASQDRLEIFAGLVIRIPRRRDAARRTAKARVQSCLSCKRLALAGDVVRLTPTAERAQRIAEVGSYEVNVGAALNAKGARPTGRAAWIARMPEQLASGFGGVDTICMGAGGPRLNHHPS